MQLVKEIENLKLERAKLRQKQFENEQNLLLLSNSINNDTAQVKGQTLSQSGKDRFMQSSNGHVGEVVWSDRHTRQAQVCYIYYNL